MFAFYTHIRAGLAVLFPPHKLVYSRATENLRIQEIAIRIKEPDDRICTQVFGRGRLRKVSPGSALLQTTGLTLSCSPTIQGGMVSLSGNNALLPSAP